MAPRPPRPLMSAFSTIAEEKKALRKALRAQLSAMPAQALQAGDRALFAAFLSLPQVQQAQTLFLFWGVPGREPDTAPLVRELTARGKRVGLPRMLPSHEMEIRLYEPDRELVCASFSIWEPPQDAPLLSPGEIDLTLVPALCYDRRCVRLGFGGGYYDRWLAGYRGFSVGLCRDALLQDRVPAQSHDRRVDLVLTETLRIPADLST